MNSARVYQWLAQEPRQAALLGGVGADQGGRILQVGKGEELIGVEGVAFSTVFGFYCFTIFFLWRFLSKLHTGSAHLIILCETCRVNHILNALDGLTQVKK